MFSSLNLLTAFFSAKKEVKFIHPSMYNEFNELMKDQIWTKIKTPAWLVFTFCYSQGILYALSRFLLLSLGAALASYAMGVFVVNDLEMFELIVGFVYVFLTSKMLLCILFGTLISFLGLSFYAKKSIEKMKSTKTEGMEKFIDSYLGSVLLFYSPMEYKFTKALVENKNNQFGMLLLLLVINYTNDGETLLVEKLL